MKRTALLLSLAAGLVLGCTVPQDHALEILQGAGYSDINLRGHAWYACSDDDTRSTKFSAKGPTGKQVSGAVCCGFWAKNCTIRMD